MWTTAGKFSTSKSFPHSANETWITRSLAGYFNATAFIHHSLESALMSPLMKKSVLNRFVTGLVGLILAVGLTGCSNDDDEPLDDTIDASETESLEYVPASADGPAQNVPEPKLPAVATENTEEGAEATYEYFWEAEEYARLTGDTDPLAAVSSDECAFCQDSIEGWEDSYDNGEWTVLHGNLELDISDIKVGFGGAEDRPVAHILYRFHEPATDFYDTEGSLSDSSFEKPEVDDWFALLGYDGTAQKWKVEWLGLEEAVEWEDQ